MAVLKATERTEIGTRKVRSLRREGLIPCIVYGHGKDAVPITLSRHDLETAIHHGERLLEIKLGGHNQNVLIKEVQQDTFGQEILHVDLTRVSLDERVRVTVPIVLRGTPAGLDQDGVLQQAAANLEIECRVNAIPDEIRVSVTHLNVGDSIHMKDLELPESAVLVSNGEVRVCSVSVLAEEEVAEEAAPEGTEEPEVIGEQKEAEAPESPAEDQ
ncbi:MAG: 50S ribosomal protein L25 [Phycisphaerae bacterium]|jgi:large subunit ribosomal protein L25|nr:50S ribosomal protein L25 [Phycisphaerae bacterium]MDP7636217.1 50S ribosomal protein L25 [Phycisphaerae bacterium]